MHALRPRRPRSTRRGKLDTQVTDQYKSEVSPEIDTLRAHVELHTAEQRLTDAINDFEKDKLTLDRFTGIPLEDAWNPAGDYGYVALVPDAPEASHIQETRFDVASAKAGVSSREPIRSPRNWLITASPPRMPGRPPWALSMSNCCTRACSWRLWIVSA
jgi:hypothetical protein